MEMKDLCAGLLVRINRASGFKVAVVVGKARDPDKVRICIWSANKETWSQPQAHDPKDLAPLNVHEYTSSRYRTITRAARDIQVNRGQVKYKNGAAQVGTDQASKVFAVRSSEAVTVPMRGVTKLAPVAGIASKRGTTPPLVITQDDKSKLQRINSHLTEFMFGGKRGGQ